MSERDIEKTAKDVHDEVDEARHRTIAGAEHAKRDIAGDALTPGERLKSATNEAKHDVEAEIDHLKRDVRDS